MEKEIKVYLNSAYLKKAFLVDIIVIPFCALMMVGRSTSISGFDTTFLVRASAIFGIAMFVIVTIFLLIQYFSKKPMSVINEKGIYKGSVFFLLPKEEESILYNWSSISSISFVGEIAITLNDTEKTKLILFCNENEDVPVIRNQILSKFHDQIEFFNIEIIQK